MCLQSFNTYLLLCRRSRSRSTNSTDNHDYHTTIDHMWTTTATNDETTSGKGQETCHVRNPLGPSTKNMLQPHCHHNVRSLNTFFEIRTLEGNINESRLRDKVCQLRTYDLWQTLPRRMRSARILAARLARWRGCGANSFCPHVSMQHLSQVFHLDSAKFWKFRWLCNKGRNSCWNDGLGVWPHFVGLIVAMEALCSSKTSNRRQTDRCPFLLTRCWTGERFGSCCLLSICKIKFAFFATQAEEHWQC